MSGQHAHFDCIVVKTLLPDLLEQTLTSLFIHAHVSAMQQDMTLLAAEPRHSCNVLFWRQVVPFLVTEQRHLHEGAPGFLHPQCLTKLVLPAYSLQLHVCTEVCSMPVSGVIPIDRLTDVRTPVAVVCQRISRAELQRVYGLKLPKPDEHDAPNK